MCVCVCVAMCAFIRCVFEKICLCCALVRCVCDKACSHKYQEGVKNCSEGDVKRVSRVVKSRESRVVKSVSRVASVKRV